MCCNGRVRGVRVHIRVPCLDDMQEFLRAVRRSAALHRGWVSPPSSPAAFRSYINRAKRDDFRACLICQNDSGAIAGVVNISQIFRGPFQSAYLGFYALLGHEAQGLMREGLKLVLRHAFSKLRVHRLEANIQPQNARSLSLIKSLGFRLEGFSPRYLKIAGRWRDHERWAILREDFLRQRNSGV